MLSLAANQPTRRSITSNVYPRCSAFTSCATVSPVIPFSFSILLPFRYPFDCLWNVTSCDRPSSLAVCSQLQRTGTRVADLLKVCRFEKAGNERTNERTNGGHSPGEWIVRNSFVLPLTRQSASLNYLFQYIFFFWPVADSTVPIGLSLLIEKGLSVVSNPFNIAGNLTTFLKQTAVNVLPRANTNDTGCAVILKNFLLRVSVQENLYIFSWHIQNSTKSESAEYSVEKGETNACRLVKREIDESWKNIFHLFCGCFFSSFIPLPSPLLARSTLLN